jgi:VWFA-related protein
VTPDRYIAYFFDDIHLESGDLMRVRDAAGRSMDALLAADRAAIFTTSGQLTLDFTNDRAKLHETLAKLRPNSQTGGGGYKCPDVGYHMADLILNLNDPLGSNNQPLDVATQETFNCLHLDRMDQMSMARSYAVAAARSVLNAGNHETHVSLLVLQNVVRRVSVMPGQRSIILVSPGFLTLPDLLADEFGVEERAIHGNILINTLDARGLYTEDSAGAIDAQALGDSKIGIMPTVQVLAQKTRYAHEETAQKRGVLAELAAATGGSLFENSNDLDAGFKRLAGAPECIYLLGFSPETMKADGSYHQVKVSVKSRPELKLQARRGYYTPKPGATAQGEAEQEIESAVIARDEVHELPVELQTQVTKVEGGDSKLEASATVDLKQVTLRKAGDRNENAVTIVWALFDGNGVFLSGVQKVVQFKLKDQTVEHIAQTPQITVKTAFDVKPGSYLLRMVARDTEGRQMAAGNGAVEVQ